MTLPTVEVALARMLETVTALSPETVPVAEADGRWLAAPVLAARDQPPFDASAMDGWAVRTVDIEQGAALTIVGESAAGRRAQTSVGPGQTVRISTGAPLPQGADRVVIQEEAERRGDLVICEARADAPSHVRARGCDFVRGQALIDAGDRLNPWRLALAASAGAGNLLCGARPRVAILSTGDELVAPGAPAGPDQIYDSAGPALAALVARQGGRAAPLPLTGDNDTRIAEIVATTPFDLLVTIGGASVGDHDRVKPALKSLGAVLQVEGVAMRPGKPVWFATLPDGRRVLGLPGNPASALVCGELFLAPILARLQGGEDEDRFETAILATPLPANGPRDHYIRARAVAGPDGRRRVTPLNDQDSSLVTILAAAKILIRRAPHVPAADLGEMVEVLQPTR